MYVLGSRQRPAKIGDKLSHSMICRCPFFAHLAQTRSVPLAESDRRGREGNSAPYGLDRNVQGLVGIPGRCNWLDDAVEKFGSMPIVPPSRDEIIAIISEEARIDEAKLTSDVTLASLDIASLDVVSVLFAIEDKYGVEIPVEAINPAQTLGQFVDGILAKVSAV